jgi:hypothetical protein
MSPTLTSDCYRCARLMATGRAVTHHRVTHRVYNIAKGRTLARLGFWRRLWR